MYQKCRSLQGKMFGICGDGSNVFLPAQTMAGGKLFEKSFPNAFSERRPLFRNFSRPGRQPARPGVRVQELREGRGPSEALRLLKQAGPAAGTAVKSLWKGVWGKTFLQKGFPQDRRRDQGLNQDFLSRTALGGNCFSLAFTRPNTIILNAVGQWDKKLRHL